MVNTSIIHSESKKKKSWLGQLCKIDMSEILSPNQKTEKIIYPHALR